MPMPSERAWLWLAFLASLVVLVWHLRRRKAGAEARMVFVEGNTVKVDFDSSGGDARVRLLERCPDEDGHAVFVSEIIEWMPFAEERTPEAQYVWIKCKLNAIPSFGVAAFIASPACAEAVVLSRDRIMVSRDASREIEK